MVRLVLFLAAFFSHQFKGGTFCTKPIQGTFANAFEARVRRFCARGTFRCWFLHCARVGRIFGEGIVESESVGFFDAAVAGGDDCVRGHFCLSPHRAAAEVTSVSDHPHRDVVDACIVCSRFDTECAHRADRADSTRWTTRRVLDRFLSALRALIPFLKRSQGQRAARSPLATLWPRLRRFPLRSPRLRPFVLLPLRLSRFRVAPDVTRQ